METQIENILSVLVLRVIEHFGLNGEDALAAVAQSSLANELSQKGNIHNLSVDQLSEKLFLEIANGE